MNEALNDLGRDVQGIAAAGMPSDVDPSSSLPQAPPQPQISFRNNSDDEIVDFIAAAPPVSSKSIIERTAMQMTRYLERKGNDTDLALLLGRWPAFFNIASEIERDQFLRLLLTHAQLFAIAFSELDDATWMANEALFQKIALNTLAIVNFLEAALPEKRNVFHSLFANYVESLVDCARAVKLHGAQSNALAIAEKRLRKQARAMELVVGGGSNSGDDSAENNDSEHVSIILFEPKQATCSATAELLKIIHGPEGTGTHLNLKTVRLHGFHQTEAVRNAIVSTRKQNIHKVIVIAIGVRATSAVMKYLGTIPNADVSPVQGVIFFQSLVTYNDELDGNLVEHIFHKLVDKPLANFEHFTKQIDYNNLKHSAPYLIIDTEQEHLDEIQSMTRKSKDASIYTFKRIDGERVEHEFAKEVEYFVRQFENMYY